MSTIHVLPPHLANQIAAGEVVERPASAVKELVENALDAHATRCEVELVGGGITRLTVIDDGDGMSEEDARLSVERHATSKLQSVEDLEELVSYGFRGEALPSIASVSRFRLRTRRREDDAATELRVLGGQVEKTELAGAPPGTTVEVEDLFFNVPARRKFLKASGTEAGHIVDVVESAALCRPDVTFLVSRDGRKVRQLLRAADRASRVAQLFEEEELIPCAAERGPLRIEAFLSRPERSRQGASGLRVLINGRPVRDRMLAATVAQAYGAVLERGRYPRGVVFLELPPRLVDVNVHPQKSEVRLADPRSTADALYGVISRGLASALSTPIVRRRYELGRPESEPTAATPTAPAVSAPARAELEPSPAPPHVELPSPRAATPLPKLFPSRPPLHPTSTLPKPAFESRDAAALLVQEASAPGFEPQGSADTSPIRPRPSVRWAHLRFVAQLQGTYLVCEDEQGLYILDQHSASERVAFDRLRRQYRAESVKSQALLFPITVKVSPSEAKLVAEAGPEITSVGFDVRVRGEDLVSIHGVPRLLERASPERLLRDLLAELGKGGGPGFTDAVDLALATLACHGALRSGDPVTAEAAAALLAALDQADFAGHCPHGRPVVTFTSWHELERKVGRR